MLTNFKNIKSLEKVAEQKREQENAHNERLQLLFEAIDKILAENSSRIYIQEYPYRVELKLPTGLELKELKNQTIQTSESKNVGEGILVHTFLMLEKYPSFEIWYKPISTPRL